MVPLPLVVDQGQHGSDLKTVLQVPTNTRVRLLVWMTQFEQMMTTSPHFAHYAQDDCSTEIVLNSDQHHSRSMVRAELSSPAAPSLLVSQQCCSHSGPVAPEPVVPICPLQKISLDRPAPQGWHHRPIERSPSTSSGRVNQKAGEETTMIRQVSCPQKD